MPQIVDLKVGFSCNDNCVHCVVADKRSEPDLTIQEIQDVVERYIGEYSEIGIVLTGGEVTYRHDYLDILRFLKSLKDSGHVRTVELQTNGRMLSDEGLLDKTVGVVDYYLVALHSGVAEVHDAVTSRPGSFAETTRALALLARVVALPAIVIQSVISRKNHRHLHTIYPFIRNEYGITECNITFPHPLGAAFSTRVTPRYCEVTGSVNAALGYCLENDMGPQLEALPPCVFTGAQRTYATKAVLARDVKAVGYAGKKDEHIDYGEVEAESWVKYDSCRKCELNNCCPGVWREYKRLYPHDDLFQMQQGEEVRGPHQLAGGRTNHLDHLQK
ncbi:MAG: radical SAM protein [Chlorobium sp.]|jgi:MoaA/NifB/PqqE/SkfB family radical SAM enzyme|nr:radical SAM protein [Chlorobium sp.]